MALPPSGAHATRRRFGPSSRVRAADSADLSCYGRAMRADARRNRSAVLDAGARLLAERPTASMQEIADASGVGRTTVYRHFPAREDLVAALIDQVAEEALHVMERAIAADGTAPDVLRRLAHDIVALGRRWSFLRAQRDAVRAAAQD